MTWFHAAQAEMQTYFDTDESISEVDRNTRGIRAIDGFHDLYLELAAEIKINEDWPTPHYHISRQSTRITEHSLRSGSDYTLGIGLFGWFIESRISAPDHIRHMKDDFWLHIAKLSSIGKAELHDYGRSSGVGRPLDFKPTKKLYQHQGSLVFAIARDFLFDFYCHDRCDSLGAIHLNLPLESDEATVRMFYRKGLEGLYRSNHLLHRYANHQRQRNTKKHVSQI